MGKEKEIDLYHADDSEFQNIEPAEDTIKGVLDERDYIPPLKEIEEKSFSNSEKDDPEESSGQDEQEIDMPSDENQAREEDSQPEQELEINLEAVDAPLAHSSTDTDAEMNLPDDTREPVEDDPVEKTSEDEKDASVTGILSVFDEAEDEAANDEVQIETEALPGGDSSDLKNIPAESLSNEPAADNNADDFVGLDEGDLDAEEIPATKGESNAPNPFQETEAVDKSEAATSETIENDKTLKKKNPLKEVDQTNGQAPETGSDAKKLSAVNKIICGALILLLIAAVVIYFNPKLIGLTRIQEIETAVQVEFDQPVDPAPRPEILSAPSSKRDQCLAKIADAAQLRNELMEKKDEIYELNLHYHNGIAELEHEIRQQIKAEGLSSYEEAMKNSRISLSMRTIQRRLAYIKELQKPAYWLNSGSEELYYLVRKAEVDLQLTEIAGGIDLNKHVRHISAAIQKYRPSPDKLTIDPLQAKLQPLEHIWHQMSTEKEKQTHISLNSKDEIIVNQICAGNFSRIAELTTMSPRAAKCLSRMKGSDLFLNGLKTLTPDAARQLFQWRGNWICLNGVSQLSEPVAQQLFEWKGNWISLNSLNEFPPELAKYLLKWEGQQLELMGLEYNQNEADKKTVKYLALWETTGGKLFVPDQIRQEIENLM